MSDINLDHNATTPSPPEVIEAMARAMRAGHGNPASQHRLGQAAREVLEDARERIAARLGAKLSGSRPDRLIFTASATEANNLAIRGIATARSASPGQVIVSSIEHQSVMHPAERLLEEGWRLDTLSVSRAGVVQLESLDRVLQPETAVVSVILGSHDTGVLQPVAELAQRCNTLRVPLHTDAVQVVGKQPIEFRKLGVAALSLAAHKFGGPVGIGALVLRHDTPIEPLLYGGHQQAGLRPGTESVPLVVGMLAALELCHERRTIDLERLTALRERFERGLTAAIPGAIVHGRESQRLPQTCNVALPEADGQMMLMALSLAGVACSIGSACESGSAELSSTLLAMGLPAETAARSLRFSLGTTTSEAKIDEAIRRIGRVWGQVRGRDTR